jgi:hypothetical protein
VAKKSLAVGDLCITVNASSALLNNGLLVVIVSIDSTQRNHHGVPTPYKIKRIDGQPIPCSSNHRTGELHFFKLHEVWSVGRKLKRVDPKARDTRKEALAPLEA